MINYADNEFSTSVINGTVYVDVDYHNQEFAIEDVLDSDPFWNKQDNSTGVWVDQ